MGLQAVQPLQVASQLGHFDLAFESGDGALGWRGRGAPATSRTHEHQRLHATAGGRARSRSPRPRPWSSRPGRGHGLRRLQYRLEVLDMGERLGRTGRVTKAPTVVGDHLVRGGERVELRLPHPPIRHSGMQKDDGAPGRRQRWQQGGRGRMRCGWVPWLGSFHRGVRISLLASGAPSPSVRPDRLLRQGAGGEVGAQQVKIGC